MGRIGTARNSPRCKSWGILRLKKKQQTKYKQMKHYINKDIFRRIAKVAKQENLQVFVIGGFVRDLLLKRSSKDIDIVVVGNGIKFAKALNKELGGKNPISVFKNFGTAMLKYKSYEIEFVGARKESYNRNSRNPIVENGSLQDDQNRRDFTINAMALSLNEETFGNFIDPFDGINDLKNKIIRTPLEPDITFSDDPLRMMRAIRFATQLNFKIEEKTLQALKSQSHRIEIISKERINDELHKIIMSKKPSIGFKLLDQVGLLKLIFPEMDNLKGVKTINGMSHKDNFLHTIQVLDNISRHTDDLWLRWAAILHDIGKPDTKRFTEFGWTFHGHEAVGAKMVPEIFRKMKLPMNHKMKFVQKLVFLHLRPIALVSDIVTDSAIRRLLNEAGDDVESLMTLCEADITTKKDEKLKRFLNNFKIVRQKMQEVEEMDAVRNFQPPVSGTLIIETFDIQPSKIVGEIKSAIKEAILDGKIKNDKEEAFQYMMKIGEDMGLKTRKIC